MKKKTIKISIRVIAIFIIAITLSFVPDLLPNFFGDWFCQGHTTQTNTDCQYGAYYDSHNPEWHWGYRHWLWLFMGISLFIIQVIDIITFLEKES